MRKNGTWRIVVLCAGVLALGAGIIARLMGLAGLAPRKKPAFAFSPPPAGSLKPLAPRAGMSLYRRAPLPLRGQPGSLCASSLSGGVWVSAGSGIAELAADGTVRSFLSMDAAVTALAPAGDGSTLVAMGSRVARAGARGIRELIRLDASAMITDMAVDGKSGDIFIADAGNRTVLRYSSSGALVNRIGEAGPGFVVPSPYFSLALDGKGRVVVANPGRHGIETYEYSGALVSSWYRPGSAPDAFAGCCNPVCLDILADGTVLTVEKGLSRVKIMSPEGRLIGIVTGSSGLPRAEDGRTRAGFHGDRAAALPDGGLAVLDRDAGELRLYRRDRS